MRTVLVKSVASGAPLRPTLSRLVLWAFLLVGIATLAYYLSWRLADRHLSPHPSASGVVLVYSFAQLLGNWLLDWAAGPGTRAVKPVADDPPTFDVFLTVYVKDIALVDRALAAAVTMRVPHRTWRVELCPP